MTGSASVGKQISEGAMAVGSGICQGCVLSSGTADKFGHLGKEFYCLTLVADRPLP
jgi:hypothetical protein